MRSPLSARIDRVTIAEDRPALVVDASVAIGIVRRESVRDQALAQLGQRRRRGSRLLVPSLFWVEVLNVLGRRYLLAPPDMLEALVELEAAGLETVELDRPMLLLALDAVVRHGLTAYDAAYLALADAADAQLLTADATLAAAAGIRGILVGRDDAVRESPGGYQPTDAPAWAAWPGAAAYLRELRARHHSATGSAESLRA
jgi:predicted nucleic acid-binding protein